MHSRVYAERMDKARGRMVQAVALLRESGLVEAPESLPVDRDPRITELLRMEYVADVLDQLASSVGEPQIISSGELIIETGEPGEQITVQAEIELPPAVNVGKSDKAKGKK